MDFNNIFLNRFVVKTNIDHYFVTRLQAHVKWNNEHSLWLLNTFFVFLSFFLPFFFSFFFLDKGGGTYRINLLYQIIMAVITYSSMKRKRGDRISFHLSFLYILMS